MRNAGALAKTAILWNAGFSVLRDLLQFVVALLLARLVHKAAFAQQTLIQSILAFVSVFSGKATLDHILQLKEGDEPPYQDHFTAAGVLQFGVFLIINAIALGVRVLPDYASISIPLHAISFIALADWIAHFRYRQLERQLEFKRFRSIHGIGILSSSVVSVLMAWLGCGIYSLLLPTLLTFIPFAWDLFVREKWRPTWQFDFQKWKPSLVFALSTCSAAALMQGRNLLEASAMAGWLTFDRMSELTRAQGLARMFCVQIIVQIIYSIYPLLTRVSEESGQAARSGLLVMQAAAWLSIPMAGFFSLVCEPAIWTMYGGVWAGVVAITPWAMVWGVVSALNQTAFFLLLSRSETHYLLQTGIWHFLLSGLALLFLKTHGLFVWLAVSSSIMLLLTLAMCQKIVRMKLLEWPSLAASCAPPILAVGLALGILLPLRAHWPILPGTNFFAGVLWGIPFWILILLVLRVLFPQSMAELVRRLPGSRLTLRWLRLN